MANPPEHTKERVREYMERRHSERRKGSHPPLDQPEQIRREIGWDAPDRRQRDRRSQ